MSADPEQLVSNELLVVDLAERYGTASALLSWSMTRAVGSTALRVVATGDEASIVAGDLRFELLTDPVSHELTRGVTVVLHNYESVESSSGTAKAMLRRKATSLLTQQVIEHCYRVPEQPA